MKDTIEELFSKPEWTGQEWTLFLDLLENQSPDAMQYVFQENFISKLPEADSHPSAKARQLLYQIHTKAGIHNQPAGIIRMGRGNYWKKIAVAASILLVVGTGYWLIREGGQKQEIAKNFLVAIKDIPAPKGTKAMITLSNGQTVALDSVSNGTLATQGDVKVIKNENGEIVYSALRQAQGDIQYNTLSNPRGSKVVNLMLADGSKVWLNAGSSLTYPVAFIGNERKVSITGEAYFAVSHNAKMPFKIMVNGTELQDLGTEFNVNAYADEPVVKTTLIEGSIRVVNGDNAQLLIPGQQAQISPEGKISLNKNVDVEEVVAWKNGVFRFESQDIQTVMRQLSRWYDVEVNNKTKTSRHFTGIISRNVNVSEVLKMLEMAGEMHFSIEGKKVTVE